ARGRRAVDGVVGKRSTRGQVALEPQHVDLEGADEDAVARSQRNAALDLRAIQECAVGAPKVFDAQLAVFEKHPRMTPRDERTKDNELAGILAADQGLPGVKLDLPRSD